MQSTFDDSVRAELEHRRALLVSAISTRERSVELTNLLQAVDRALAKIASGKYGLCETCSEPIEADRLAVFPLVRNCLDHLSPLERENLERDLDLAAQVQTSFLPERDFAPQGWATAFHYDPAGSVSGDYLDCFFSRGNDQRFAFFVGDVAGKGVAASLLMSQLHAIFRSLMVSTPPLATLLEHANRLFCERTASQHFATLVAGFASSEGEIEICNAGHCPPILVRAGRIETLSPTTFPLGMFCRGTYRSTMLHLSKGDKLVLYTDGVTEARNTVNVLYSEERLHGLIAGQVSARPPEMVASVVKDLENYRSGARRLDDVTVLVMQRT